MLKKQLKLLVLCCATFLATSISSVTAKPYNIVMIAVDDLNTWTGHLHENPNTLTPNIDKLASHGVSFKRAYTPAPACRPARAALLSGVAPYQSHVYNNGDDDQPVKDNNTSIGQYFAQHGYATLATGKLFHSPKDNKGHWQTIYNPKQLYKQKREIKFNGLEMLPKAFDWGAIDRSEEDTPDFDKATWAAKQLEKSFDKPFFLAVGLFRPHLPWYAPQKYFDRFPLGEIKLPLGFKADDREDLPARSTLMGTKPKDQLSTDHQHIAGHGQWKRALQGYLASINYVDEAIGRIYDALLNSQYADNTIVVLWGDHGWQLGEKMRWRKFSLWSAGSRTSFIVKVPGITPKGVVSKAPVDLMSIYPTLIKLAGLPKNKKVTGHDISPILKDPGVDWNKPALTSMGDEYHSVRYKNWSYIRYSTGDEELYNLDKDPWEWHNLASDEDTAKIRKKLAKMLPKVRK